MGLSPDYDRGLAALKAALPGEHQAALLTLEDRLQSNLRKEKLFGGTETTRADRSAIIYELNDLALRVLGISFNDLCVGQVASKPASDIPPAVETQGSPVVSPQAFANLAIHLLPRQEQGYPVDLI